MNRNRAVAALLYLYPRAFRERFADDVHEYVANRCDEAGPDWRLRVRFCAGMALDLAGTAFSERARAWAVGRVALWCSTLATGFVLAGLLLGVTLLTFTAVVRAPLLEIGTEAASGVWPLAPLAGLAITVGALLLTYARLWRSASSRR